VEVCDIVEDDMLSMVVATIDVVGVEIAEVDEVVLLLVATVEVANVDSEVDDTDVLRTLLDENNVEPSVV
jgi:hypothetical protein